MEKRRGLLLNRAMTAANEKHRADPMIIPRETIAPPPIPRRAELVKTLGSKKTRMGEKIEEDRVADDILAIHEIVDNERRINPSAINIVITITHPGGDEELL